MMKKILVIDDDPSVGFLTKHFIEKALPEFKVESLMNPLDAEGYIQKMEKSPEIILIDINMPQENGFNTLLHLKLLSKLNECCFAVYSTSGDPANVKEAIRLNVGYIVKNYDKLIEQIQNLLSGKFEYPKESNM